MASKVIIFTGAPRPSSLKWDNPELLQDASTSFSVGEANVPAIDTGSTIKWRSLAPINNKFTYTPPTVEGGSFFTMGAIQSFSGESVTIDTDATVLSAFYDHSFAFHEGICTTASFSDGKSLNEDSNISTTSLWATSNDDSNSKFLSQENNQQEHTAPAISGHLSDIEDIPDAAYLQSIAPHTINVNLITAIIAIQPRRRVRTRWGREMDIVELLVGDETKSGFRITCWVPPLQDGAVITTRRGGGGGEMQNRLEESLEILRPRDIILLRSVALSSFQGKVYGQSLRNNATRIDVLNRQAVGATDMEGVFPTRMFIREKEHSDPQIIKVSRVRAWILDFIGVGISDGGGDQDDLARQGAAGFRAVPQDTQ